MATTVIKSTQVQITFALIVMNHTIYSMCQHYCNQVYVLVSASCLDIKKIVSYVLSNSVTNFTTVVLGVKVTSTSFIIHVTVLWLWFP